MASRGRNVGIIFIVLALILVIVLGAAAIFFKDYFFPAAPVAPPLSNGTPAAPAVKTMDIVVLTQNINFGQSVPEAALGFAPIPNDRFVEGLYFKTKEDVKGKRARYQLSAGTILTTGMVSETAVGSYASGQIPPGYVAIPIPVNVLTSVANALQPGDHVAVLVALMLEELDPNFQSKLPNTSASVGEVGETTAEGGPKNLTITINGNGEASVQGRTELDPVLNKPIYVQPSENQRPRIVTQLLISDAMVLGIGRFPKNGGLVDLQATPTPPPPGAAPTAAAVTPTPPPDTDMVTLVVSPQDAVTLNYILLNKGARLNLVLRGAGDTKAMSAEPVTLQFLMDQNNIPFPSKLPYGLEPRVDSLEYDHDFDPALQPTVAPPPQ